MHRPERVVAECAVPRDFDSRITLVEWRIWAEPMTRFQQFGAPRYKASGERRRCSRPPETPRARLGLGRRGQRLTWQSPDPRLLSAATTAGSLQLGRVYLLEDPRPHTRHSSLATRVNKAAVPS